MNTKTTATKKIAELDSKIRGIAFKFSRSTGVYIEADELHAEMVLKILEQSKQDPKFIEQTDAYILQFAKFHASHVCQKAQVYLRFVDELGNVTDPESEESAEDCEIENLSREKLMQKIMAVESQAMLDETMEAFITTAKDRLTTSELETVYMLYMGYKPVEIAEVQNISKSAVSQRISKIAKKLEGFEQ